MALPAGTILAGRYRLVRPIGQGGMGTVYEAEHTALGRRVALKVLFDDDAKAIKRFQQEGRAMAKLAHPHIVSIVDYIAQVGDPPMLVMELLEGVSLATVLRREGALEPERAVRLATQMLRGLAAAHDAGVIHRDVKPSNVFLVKDERGDESVKLLDFGVAKLLLDRGGVNTTLGGVVGTTAYLAPEQIELAKGQKIDGRVDVHAVGTILFEMLAGRKPWRAKSAVDVEIEIARGGRQSLREVRPDLSSALCEAVDKALVRDRDHRHRDAHAMLRALSVGQVGGGSVKDTILDSPPANPKNTLPMASAPPPRPPSSVVPPKPAPTASSGHHGRTFVALLVGLLLGAIATIAAVRHVPRFRAFVQPEAVDDGRGTR